MECEVNDCTRVERSERIVDVKIEGVVEQVYQESTCKENEGKMAVLVSKLEEKLRCVFTGKLTTNNLQEYAERGGESIVMEDLVCEGLIASSR